MNDNTFPLKKQLKSCHPQLTFENGKMTSFAMLPIYLNFDRKDDMNGLPIIAPPVEAEEIFNLLNELSAPYGTTFQWDGKSISLG